MVDKPRNTQPALWSGSPFPDFRKQMDRLVEDFFGSPFDDTGARDAAFPAMRNVVAPPIDVSEDDSRITLTAELPGMAEDDVDLLVRDGVLTLKGEKKTEREEDKEDVHIMERSYGSFQRTMTLPDRVDAAAIEAKFENGVLKVIMPKKPEAKAGERKIAIGK